MTFTSDVHESAGRGPNYETGHAEIELYSGEHLDLINPDPDRISIIDVAHGLSMKCRFSGQCHDFCSVAEHAVRVADRLRAIGAPAEVQLVGLHHDDGEAFLPDVSSPLKPLLEGFAELEERVMEATAIALGIADLPFDDVRVKAADNWALAAEAYHLLPSRAESWAVAALYDPTDPKQKLVYGRTIAISASNAYNKWMIRHRELLVELGRAL
jgi:hypothetical protein